MTDYTARDKAWAVLVEHLIAAEPIQTRDITESVDIHKKTARAVLRVAQDAEFIRRDSPKAQTWHPNVGPLSDVDDPEYQRAIQTLVHEAKDNRDN